MKRIILSLGAVLLGTSAFSQYWNDNGNIVASGQFLGSQNNQPLQIRTNNINRLKLNGNLSYTIDGYNDTRNGYLLIGIDN